MLTFANFLSPAMTATYQAIAEYIGMRLGVKTRTILGQSLGQFATGTVDVGFICGLPYIQLAAPSVRAVELLAAPIFSAERYQNKPIYFSDVIVRIDNPANSFADLRRKVWVYNETASHSGYNIVRAHLANIGGAQGYFGRVLQSGAHRRSMQLVAAGLADASAIDSHVLTLESALQPEVAERLKVIDTLGPSPVPPIVVASRLPDALKFSIRAFLLEVNTQTVPAIAITGIKKLVPMRDSDYDPIREMYEKAKTVVW